VVPIRISLIEGTNYEKIILIFVVLSIALARLGTILRVVREITRSKKNKNVNFQSKSEMCKRSIVDPSMTFGLINL
jgi:alcohol dehydrogenase YqhD (iron-dependent ADH family)